MAKRFYIQYLPVASDSVADLLKNTSVWESLSEVRKSGRRGITAKEIAKKTGHSEASVYNALRMLHQHRLVDRVRIKRERTIGRPRKEEVWSSGKTPWKYIEPCEQRTIFKQSPAGEPENPWGDIIFSQDFIERIIPKLKEELEKTQLKDRLREFTADFYRKHKDDLKDVMPGEKLCDKCGRSHDGYEFLKAIIFYVAASSVEASEVKDTLKELGFARKNKKII